MEYKNSFELPNQKFSSPEEEINYLRKQILEKEKQIKENSNYAPTPEKVIEQTVHEYKHISPEEVMHKESLVPEMMRNEIVLKLSPEEHDEQMAELVQILQEKGVINAIAIVDKMNSPHLQDDFHRFLVQYIKEGYLASGLKDKDPLFKNLKRTLFEVSLPDFRGGEQNNIQELFAKMEQFYSGMLSIERRTPDDYLTIEIANSIGSKEFIFFISVSDENVELFEKQLMSIFPEAKIQEQKDDFNIFNKEGATVGAVAGFSGYGAKSIKTYNEFTNEPLKVLLNVFSKLDTFKEAAAIQFVFKPVGDFYLKNYKKGLSKLEKGDKGAEEFHIRNTTADKIRFGFTKAITKIASSGSDKKDESKKSGPDSGLIETVKNKVSSPIVSANIRIIASSINEHRAEEIVHDLQSAFNQFENTFGNKFKFEIKKNSNLKPLVKDFSYRKFNIDNDLPLNIKEFATIIHLPDEQKDLSSQLKTVRAKTAPAPNNVADQGILIGYNEHQNHKTPIYFSPMDRLRHFYVIGQTGTGKSTILKNMIIQDIKNGDGVCFIDPHGNDIQDILANIPKERYDDVIYFDPAYAERPMGLNMLEFDRNMPEQKTFVVNELFSIFQKLYGEQSPESMGPMFEQYFRNSTMLVIEDPDSGCTLLEVSRVMADAEFRKMKLANCKNPIVVQFWKEIAEKAGGEASLANIVPYIVSKFDVFLANDIMRPVVAQEKSSFNFREVMDNKKILLVNLSKGRLGDINSNLVGLILVGKILMAALSRVDSFDKGFSPFYLYIDEFQNVTTPSISTILSEARKYKLSLNIAHQFIGQLTDKIKDSVFGNVGSVATFRVGAEDAKFLESQFQPTFEAKDIMNIDNFNAYIKMLANGMTIKPFSVNLKECREPEGDRGIIPDLKQLSYLKYGRNREEVEAEILKKYEKKKPEMPDFSKFQI